MNRREILELVTDNSRRLEQSDQNFEAIYELMFRFTDNVLAEYNDGFRIQRCTYGQVRQQIEEVSAALYEKIGATHRYVALEMENCTEWIVTFWAILRSGNKPYLVNCRHPQKLADEICKSLEIEYVIGMGHTGISAKFIDFHSLTGGKPFAGDFENEIALSTSATSLKGVVCFYSGRELSAQLLNTELILSENRRISRFYHGELKILAFLPFYHIFGLVAVYFWFTFFGRTLVFLRDYAPDTILATVRKHEVTHIFGVPMLWHTIEKEILKKLKKEGPKTEQKFYKGLKICTALQNVFPYWGATLSKKIMHEVTDQIFGQSVQFCISGGSYIRTSALELFNGIGYPLHNGYGMSEIGITSVELRDKPKERNLSSVGHPMKSVEYRIGGRGTLEVRGASICNAIMKDGQYQKTGDWFDTGDVMTLEGDYYYIKGRMGDVVIGENGENINPDVIEQTFQLPDAAAFSVLGLAEEGKTEERLSLIVSINKFLPFARIEQMMVQIYEQNEQLPMITRIQDFYFTYDELAPATAIKVGRKYVLRGLENGTIQLIPFSDMKQQASRQEDATINPELFAKVRDIVSAALGVEPEQVQENSHLLNDFGATSLEYFAVLSELGKEFGIAAEDGEEQYRYTVHDICTYIEQHV